MPKRGSESRSKRGGGAMLSDSNPSISLAEIGEILRALEGVPDDAFVTDAECMAITRLSRTSLWRLEQTEPLLRSTKLGPKRKARRLGNVREFLRKREASVVA
jgi:predicted DNA-binding transcriptional regulator AlpA